MAGDGNPWRDIFSPAEWTLIQNQAAQAARKPVAPGAGTGWTTVALDALREIGSRITVYDYIPKDDYTRFADRSVKLQSISALCQKYLQNLDRTHTLGAKSGGGKQLTDQIDVWVNSLGKRALKKAAYLQTMKQWHDSAKVKYKDKTQLSMFLRQLAADNTRKSGTILHVTPYAAIEKIDPYHRQTFAFFPEPLNPAADTSQNEMGNAFIDYLAGNPASTPDRATNTNASFYEWLEYHPFCVGTPGVTPGAENYKDPSRISYDNLDLAYVYMPVGGMEYERILTSGGRQPLNTNTFRISGKGPPGAVAFVWDRECNLWVHEHGWDGFIHASAKQGKKVRCSGMLVAANGLATCITNQSGHYAPNAQSIYYFLYWLERGNFLDTHATVAIEHDPDSSNDGTYTADEYLNWGKARYAAPTGLTYYE
jgi:hypothetical protein